MLPLPASPNSDAKDWRTSYAARRVGAVSGSESKPREFWLSFIYEEAVIACETKEKAIEEAWMSSLAKIREGKG